MSKLEAILEATVRRAVENQRYVKATEELAEPSESDRLVQDLRAQLRAGQEQQQPRPWWQRLSQIARRRNG